jgi:hypothetical protein
MLPTGDISPHRSIPGSFWRNPGINDATARQAQLADISQLLLRTGSQGLPPYRPRYDKLGSVGGAIDYNEEQFR